jgi:hypothetical protein
MVGAEVTRLQMLWKSPGLAVEEVDLLTSAPPFQTGSEADSDVGHAEHQRLFRFMQSSQAELIAGFGCSAVFQEDFDHLFTGDIIIILVLEQV